MDYNSGNNIRCIAVVFSMAMFFLGCEDTYQRVGREATRPVYPQGVARNFKLTYTETIGKLESQDTASTRIIAILSSPVSEDFDNLGFPYRTFPEGLQVEYFNSDNQKSTITSDFGIIYSTTNVIDLKGNVVLTTHDGKKLETPQLYWDRGNEWIFTGEQFKYTNPEDGTIMDGEGMDFNREFSLLEAHRSTGLMLIKEKTS